MIRQPIHPSPRSEEKGLKSSWQNPDWTVPRTAQAPLFLRQARTLPRPASLLRALRGLSESLPGKQGRSWWARWAAGGFIAGALLILAHGCHGEDVDDEPAAGPVQRHEQDQRPLRLLEVEPAAEDSP
ncbi:MAG: hypothetical protein WHU94_05350 [Thermogemmata sp.]